MAQTPPARKRLLVIGEEKGYRHEAVTHAMVTIERLGHETGAWDTVIRTDTEALTKAKLEYNAKNLNDFDAVLFYTGGTLEMDDQKKADFAAFVHDDGKGFIGIHSAAITFTQWPAYGEMIGGYYDEHPWNTFDAPIVVEDATFPGMQAWKPSFVLTDEIYQIKPFSRSDRRVLMRLDASKLDLKNPRVHRTDNDFAVAWAKMYGKGTSLLHDPRSRRSQLGQAGDAGNDHRRDQVGAGSGRRRRHAASTAIASNPGRALSHGGLTLV